MKTLKRHWEYAVLLLPLLLAMLCVFIFSRGSQQALPSVPMPQSFIGEYSYDRENWFPLDDSAELSAMDGDLHLRGHFERPTSDEQVICYYRNHIGVTVHINGEQLYIDDVTDASAMDTKLFSSMCGQEWMCFLSPGISTQDEIEIRLHNPHRLGNESAYRDFLSTLCADIPGTNLLADNLEPYGKPFRLIGGLCAVVAMMILGAAFTAVIVRIPVAGKLVKQGLFTLFAGIFILLDAVDISFRNELVVLNTYGKHLSMMLAVLFLGHFVAEALSGRNRTVAKIALAASAVWDTALIAASLVGLTVVYDTLPFWLLSQLVLCPLLWVCCALELRRAPAGKRIVPITGLMMFAGILLDIFGAADSFVWHNPCSKILFLVLFAVHAVDAGRGIVMNQRASMRAAKLETELENSRISLMLSQIQPHFIYNVLSTIRGLCREDPMQARQALGDFSDYLRGNMNALSNNDTIHFTSEFRHIEAYVRLEKMRMGDKLNILYDIQENNFFIPPLTIQPLVENAIKHGLFEKGSGTLALHTRREDRQIIISVQDDGIGFDESEPLRQDDSHAHVGLMNVRSRLEKISGGRLVIDSAPGRGTTVTVLLPAACMEKGGMNSDERTGR